MLGSLLNSLPAYVRLRTRLQACALALGLLLRRRWRKRGPRDKPRILFVMERWSGCNPQSGLTNSMHNLVGSLEASELAEARLYHYDWFWHRTKRNTDVGLMRAIARHRPDMLFVSIVPRVTLHPTEGALAVCRRLLGLPVVFVWFDFVVPDVVRKPALTFSRIATASIVLDAPAAVTADPEARGRMLPLWTPQDPRIFRDRGLARDFDVCFLGSRARHPDRLRYLDALRSMGVRLVEGGGSGENYVSVQVYAEAMARSRIVVNFSRRVGMDAHQNKGRVFEAMYCGALLLEQRNPETAHWLEDGVDYLSFETEEELKDRVREMLADDAARERIARNGQRKVMEKYDGRRFWEEVLKAAGVRGS